MTATNTNTALETRPKKASEIMASRVSVDPAKLMQTLKSTVFKNASDDELLALVVVANEYQLNPFTKEIYAFPAKGGGIVPVVSIDGWIKIVNRQPGFDGIEFDMVEGQDGKPYSCTAKITLKDRSKPVVITEYFEECFRNTDPWKTCPRRMLRHKTLIQAGRVAFGLAGIYDEDDAKYITADVTEVKTVTPLKHNVTVMPEARQESEPANESKESTGPALNDLQEKVKSAAEGGGVTFTQVQKILLKDGINDADSVSDYPELTAEMCNHLTKKWGVK